MNKEIDIICINLLFIITQIFECIVKIIMYIRRLFILVFCISYNTNAFFRIVYRFYYKEIICLVWKLKMNEKCLSYIRFMYNYQNIQFLFNFHLKFTYYVLNHHILYHKYYNTEQQHPSIIVLFLFFFFCFCQPQFRQWYHFPLQILGAIKWFIFHLYNTCQANNTNRMF